MLKKEDIEKVKEAIKILNIVDFPKDLHKEENRKYKQIKHAIQHLKLTLPKEKEE